MFEVEHFRSESPFEPRIGFSRAVRVGHRVLVSGTAPVPPSGEPLPEDAYAQMVRCGEIIGAALEQAGSDRSRVIRTRMYIVDAADAEAVGRAHAELFGHASPAATMVVVAGLLDPAWKVEVEAEALIPSP